MAELNIWKEICGQIFVTEADSYEILEKRADIFSVLVCDLRSLLEARKVSLFRKNRISEGSKFKKVRETLSNYLRS